MFVCMVVVTCVCLGILILLKHIKFIVPNQESTFMGSAPKNSTLLEFPRQMILSGKTERADGNSIGPFLL